LEIVKILLTGRNPFQGLKDSDAASIGYVLRQKGMELVDSLQFQPDVLICVDWTPRARATISQARRLGIKTVLVVNEPTVVIIEHGKRSVLDCFDLVLMVGRPNEKPLLPWPQSWSGIEVDGSKKRIQRALMIQASKFSFVRGQLYSLRLRIAAKDNRVALFGIGWNEKAFRKTLRLVWELFYALRGRASLDFDCIKTFSLAPLAYFGPTKDKVLLMTHYKVAVVIENSMEFMSEKLFDCFFARCIPVYVGPTLVNFGIPDHLFVRAEPNENSVALGITKALAMDYDSWNADISAFLGLKETRATWGSLEAIEKIVNLALK
jgi:hypothetical protein